MLKYRPTNALDKNQITEWIAADPDHASRCEPTFFLPPNEADALNDRVLCWAVEDEHGAIFYVRAEKILRLHIQFAPKTQFRRLAAAINEFSKTIQRASAATFKQIIFESVFEPLIRFLHKRGFRSSPHEQVCDL